jgi:predicted nucleic acid-binding protein
MREFVDTNILLRMLLNDIPEQSLRCAEYIDRAIANGTTLAITATTLSELV